VNPENEVEGFSPCPVLMSDTLKQAILKCHNQLDGLYVHLGSIVYEKALKGEIDIKYDPQDQALYQELEGLLLKVYELSERSAKEPAYVSAGMEKEPGPERRGTLSPYADLGVKLHEIKKKFGNFRKDVHSCLPVASLHLAKDLRDRCDRLTGRISATESNIQTFFGKISGAVSQAMGTKTEVMNKAEGKAEFGISKEEKKFLAHLEDQIDGMAQGIDTLIGEAKTLFESMKGFYEKDAENRIRENSRQVAGADAPVAEEKIEAESVEPAAEDSGRTEEAPPAAPEEPEMVQEDAPGGSEEQTPEEAASAVDAPEEHAEGRRSSPFDESVLEVAERKFNSERASDKEKFHVLMTLFRSVETEALVSFIVRYLEKAAPITKIRVLDLVTKVDHPGLEKVYERFVSSSESLLRLKGLVGYGKMRPEIMNTLMIRAAADRDPSIRRLAANCIRPEDGNTELATLVKLSNDSDDQVARIALRKLACSKSSLAVSNLISKLRHANPKIRKEAITHLKSLEGKDYGYRPTDPEPEREKAVRAWEKFLKKSQPRLYSDRDERSDREGKNASRRYAAAGV
jgi:hypothetical protein